MGPLSSRVHGNDVREVGMTYKERRADTRSAPTNKFNRLINGYVTNKTLPFINTRINA